MGIVLYWLGINLYLLVLRIAALFHPKAKLFVKGRKGLLPQIKYALINERRPRIWMHCASLGEFEQVLTATPGRRAALQGKARANEMLEIPRSGLENRSGYFSLEFRPWRRDQI